MNPPRLSLGYNVSILGSSFTPKAQEILTPDIIETLSALHFEFEPERHRLLALRKERQKLYDAGEVPVYLQDCPLAKENWMVAPIPNDLLDRRVEITGPANSAKMVIQMLSPSAEGSLANMAMIDFEDSMKPSWENVVDAVHNIMGVAKESLSFRQAGALGTPDKIYQLNPQKMAHPMIRVRGLHLNESNLIAGASPLSASIFDLALSVLHTSLDFLVRAKTPLFYIPKCEHYLEARWWNSLLQRLEQKIDVPKGSLRTTFLIETLPAAFQMEEILYETRERATGLNGGRWDKIFSDIKTLKNHPDRVLANRASITMSSPWMENYAKRIIKICHKHGAFAMGGMSAFTPGKSAEIREIQTAKVREDKSREASIGHDGCWVSHPYFISIAGNQFAKQNQLDVMLNDFPIEPDMLPKADGPKTLEGLRTNIRVGIAYLQGWNEGIGCVSFDNLMEDLATLEISRAQTWQWLHHRLILDDGTVVTHELVKQIFEEECAKILTEVKAKDSKLIQSFHSAKNEAVAIFLQATLADFLSEVSQTN